MRPLYEISDARRVTLDELADAEGELVGDLEARLDASESNMAAKVDDVLAYAAERMAEAAACKAEAVRLSARVKAAEAHAERLRDYVVRCMVVAGVTRVEGERFKARLQATPGRVVIDDEAALGDEWVTTKVTSTPDKKAIGDAIKAGGTVPGAHLEAGVSLRVS